MKTKTLMKTLHNEWHRSLPLLVVVLLIGGCADSYHTSNVTPPDTTVAAEKKDLFELTGVGEKRTMTVTASAYNSLRGQTSGNPSITAWGDKLRPGMKAIAVSRDLQRMGLGHRAQVKIKGLPGTYLVLDRMHSRWKKKIDIYMGTDRSRAMHWGKRKVEITWFEKQNVADNIRQTAPES
jgi:3D (Asp-Asp-Asp) domain-containing protein